MPSHSWRYSQSQPREPYLVHAEIFRETVVAIHDTEGSSGVRDPTPVYPCNSGPAPINMEAQLQALDEGRIERFSNVEAPSAIILRKK